MSVRQRLPATTDAKYIPRYGETSPDILDGQPEAGTPVRFFYISCRLSAFT
jgi:hypothetical protein